MSAQGDVVAALYDPATPARASLARYASADGHLLWSAPLPSGRPTALAVGTPGTAFVAVVPEVGSTGTSYVTAMSPGGTRLWTRDVEGWLQGLGAEGGGDVVLYSFPPDPTNTALTKLSGSDGGVLWGPVAGLGNAGFGQDAAGNLFLAGSGELAAYSAANGAQLWSQPLPGTYFGKSLELRAGRLALVEGPVELQASRLTEVLAATGESLFAQPLIADSPTVWPNQVSTDSAGNVMLVAKTSHTTELRTSVIKYDGATGTPIWGPLELPTTHRIVEGRQGDVITFTEGAFGAVGLVSKYSARDGGLLWGPVAAHGLERLIETRDGNLVLLEAPSTPPLLVSKLDGQSGGVLWGPVPVEGSVYAQIIEVGGDVVVCHHAWQGPGVIRKLDGATGTPLWEQGAAGGLSGCMPGLAGNVYALSRGLTTGAGQWGPQVVESYRAADGQRLWRSRLPESAVANTILVPDVSGGVLVLLGTSSPASVLRLDAAGKRSWGPVALPGPVELAGSWDSGDVLLGLYASAPGGCDFSVARLSVQTGALAWGPLLAGDCGTRAALGPQGDVGLVSLRDGLWHVSALQGTNGAGRFDHALAPGEWPIEYRGPTFLGDDIVVAGVHGLEGLIARIGARRTGRRPGAQR